MPAEPTIGQIMPVAFGMPQNIPKGWLLCDGSLLQITQNQALFSLLSARYGGDGIKTFGIPDLRGRAVIGSGRDTMGQQQGSATVTLLEQQMPSHTHFFNASTATGSGRGSAPVDNLFGVNSAGNNLFALTGSGEILLARGGNVQRAGDGQPHDNMQPYLVINYMIATQGIYPARL